MTAATEKPLTQHMKADGTPLNLQEYERVEGYLALRQVLNGMTPAAVQSLVKDSNLKGRGGAGFSTGMKWSFVPMGQDAPRPKYLVANADEMEPGTFKDRFLLEGNPHQLIEGIIISSYAIQADIAYVFLRWEYEEAEKRLLQAIAEAYQSGLLGNNILKSPYSLELHVHVSGGRYMCGEETGLLNALEGKRANPRAKPPFPQVSGLWGKPTIVQNVETLCNIPHIVLHGAEWFKKLSATGEGGTKLYGASGRVKRPGVWELPLGVTAREILEDHAGGMKEGYTLRGYLPGGASTDFLVEEHLDVPMDFTAVTKAGSRLGTGTMIILDDRTCPVGMIHNLEHFFAQESCGWCTPCREGLPWTERLLAALEEGTGTMDDIVQLEKHCKWLGPGLTFCALAPGAVEPLQSGLKYFRPAFDQHIHEHRCPWK